MLAELPVLKKDLNGISDGEALTLLSLADPLEQERVRQRADALNLYLNGDHATYVVNHHLNFTNVCENACLFCASCRPRRHADAFLLEPEDAVCSLARMPDVTEVYLEGGVHPDLTWDYYLTLLRRLRGAFPVLHIHAFSPQEIHRMSEMTGMGIPEVLGVLRENGLDSLAGSSAEIFDSEIRRKIAPNKIRSERWIEIIRAAHHLGIPSTATILFGHVEKPEHIIDHFRQIREVQRETGGFTAFIPLMFVPQGTMLGRIFSIDSVVAWSRVRLLYAVARLYFGRWIANLQTSWVKFGPQLAAELFHWGANDICGTLYVRDGGGMDAGDLRTLIIGAGRIPEQCSTLHERAG